MPPKKDAKAPGGKGKQGKPAKDFIPANSKPPREGAVLKPVEEFGGEKQHSYLPYPVFPDWPGDEAAREHDFSLKDEEGNDVEYEDETPISLPPSFQEFEKDEIQWLRPRDFLREVAIERELQRMKDEGRTLFKRKQTIAPSAKATIRRRHTMMLNDTASEISDVVSEVGDATTPKGDTRRRRRIPKEVLDNLQYDHKVIHKIWWKR